MGFIPKDKLFSKRRFISYSKIIIGSFILAAGFVFFISPNKINDSIEYLKSFFSGRKILICREMTKFFEEYIRVDVDDLKPFQKIPKGELTLVIFSFLHYSTRDYSPIN